MHKVYLFSGMLIRQKMEGQGRPEKSHKETACHLYCKVNVRAKYKTKALFTPGLSGSTKQGRSIKRALFLQCKQTCNLWKNGGKVLFTPIFYRKKEIVNMWNTHKLLSGQFHTTCIILGFLHMFFLFPVYIFKGPDRDLYFLSEKLSFCNCCRQSGVLDVHLLYTSDYSCDFLLCQV